jgi:hypothetical protein
VLRAGAGQIRDNCAMFTEFLSATDAQRAFLSLQKLSACGFRGALAGGLAIEAHLLSQRRATGQRALNDVDVVVESFASLPGSLADGFLLHHVHAHAPEGKTLLQLIDPEQALRIDVFRQFGATFARAEALNGGPEPITMISLEDVVARTTSLVFGSLRRGRTIDPKYAEAFHRLAGLGEPVKLDAAWRDHRQAEPESFHQAAQLAQQLLVHHLELLVREPYSAEVHVCPRCEDQGSFRRARPDTIVEILGYW